MNADDETLRRFPDTVIDHDTKAFYRGWLSEELLLNRCGPCGTWHHPPRPVCPHCWSDDVAPAAVSGRGTVHLLVRLHQGPRVPGVSYDPPHPVVAVELEEQADLRFTSTVVDCPDCDLRIGMPVELTWIERHGAPYPVFRPAGTGAAR